MTTAEAIALLGAMGMGALIGRIFDYLVNRHNSDANLAEIVGKVWKGLSDELEEKVQKQDERIRILEAGEAMKNDQIKNLQCAIEKKDQQIAMLEAEIAELREYIESLGYTPPPRKRMTGKEGTRG